MYELQFPLLLDTMIANTEFESDGSGTNSLADYPLLGLENIPNVQEEWNIYTCTEQHDIANGEALVEWWEGRPESEGDIEDRLVQNTS